MKIALVLERFDPTRGGLEHWTWQFAPCLLARGHEVHVVAFEFDPATKREGIIAHRLSMPKSRLDRAAALAAYLRTVSFDIVHDMGAGWSADVIQPHAGSTKALWKHNLMRIPKWRQIRFWREKRYRELAEIERRQHTNCKAMIAPMSEMLAHNFEALDHLPRSRMRVIYNGIDTDKFTPSAREKYRAVTRSELRVREEVLFLMLAHNLLLKNADATIRGAATVLRRGAAIRVVIAGGKKPERFVKLAGKLGITNNVTFLGRVDAIPYYAAADVFVHPTWYDPCSLVTLEASSCGLPVITTRFNGAAELMTDGTEGFVLSNPANVGALAQKMEQLLDPALRAKMGAAGRRLIMHHTLDRQTDQFLDLYHEIISRR